MLSDALGNVDLNYPSIHLESLAWDKEMVAEGCSGSVHELCPWSLKMIYLAHQMSMGILLRRFGVVSILYKIIITRPIIMKTATIMKTMRMMIITTIMTILVFMMHWLICFLFNNSTWKNAGDE
ncbi:hypothetical protein BY996DRAFT_133422 [Phakopsora pachyrhizi]|nr:hypothetical protein BY996DRAFT_133422 [Phakopsora pachyrhizi]